MLPSSVNELAFLLFCDVSWMQQKTGNVGHFLISSYFSLPVKQNWLTDVQTLLKPTRVGNYLHERKLNVRQHRNRKGLQICVFESEV